MKENGKHDSNAESVNGDVENKTNI